MGVKSLAVIAMLSSAIFLTHALRAVSNLPRPAPTGPSPAPGSVSTQSRSTDLTPAEESGDKSSLGKTSMPMPSGSGSAIVPGSSPLSSTSIPSRGTPALGDTGWRVYQDETYAFLIRYPPNYVIVQPKARTQPPPVAQVWFQDRGLSTSPTANLQPPQFAIEIYENPSRLNAEDWVNANSMLPPGANFETSQADVGGLQGIRLSSSLMIAPNEFIYVTRNQFIYKITPLGSFSAQMLASFKFR